jgi:hypothetical protein
LTSCSYEVPKATTPATKKEAVKETGKKKAAASTIVLRPTSSETREGTPPNSAIDQVIVLNCEDAEILNRAAGGLYDSVTQIYYHAEKQPPPSKQPVKTTNQ